MNSQSSIENSRLRGTTVHAMIDDQTTDVQDDFTKTLMKLKNTQRRNGI